MIASGQQTAALTLNPPDLGPLQVVLSVSNDQASASFFAAQADVRHAVEAALPKLREMMNEAGVQLGQTTVSADLPSQSHTADRQPRQANPQARGHGNPDSPRQTAELALPSRASHSLLDTYA